MAASAGSSGRPTRPPAFSPGEVETTVRRLVSLSSGMRYEPRRAESVVCPLSSDPCCSLGLFRSEPASDRGLPQ
jgi:hypothetical protein